MKQLLAVLCIFISLSAFAQKEVRTINGKKHFIHVVKKKQTLYGIHKKYDVKIDAISDANQGLEGGLKVGQELLIPISLANEDYYQSHVVKKGETLYAIAKSYKVSVSDLKNMNPELAETDIQIGQSIVVPKTNLTLSEKPKDEIIGDKQAGFQVENKEDIAKPSKEDTVIRHTVLAHETLYSIAKRYMVTADDIRKRNKISTIGIKAGDVLVVPVKAVNYSIFQNKVDSSFTFNPTNSTANSIVRKPRYKIALLLPLMYSANKSVMNRPIKIGELEKLHPITKVSSDFYHGFKIAADSLAKAGLNAEVFIYDTKKDTNTIRSIFRRNDFSEIDMIVGPFFQQEIDFVANYCKSEEIPMIIPVNSNNDVLYQNPYVVKTTASTMSQIDGMVDFLTSKYSRYNVCLVKPSSTDDKALYDRARDRYNASVKPDAYSSNIIEIDLGSSSGKDWNYKLKKDTVNVIIVPSNDVKFVTSVFTRVNNVLNTNTYAKNMKVIVFGLEDWNRINDIDVKHRMRSEQHYASYRFLDYDSPTTNHFFNNFRSAYGCDPGVSGVQGFDVGYYFLSALHLYGVNYSNFLDVHSVDLVQNKFKFGPNSFENGNENRATCIVKYYNYDLRFISW